MFEDVLSIAIAAGLGGLGALFLMWLRAQFAGKEDVLAVQRQTDALATAVKHIGEDQTEHRTHGQQIAKVETDVAWLKKHATQTTRQLEAIGTQNRAIYAELTKRRDDGKVVSIDRH